MSRKKRKHILEDPSESPTIEPSEQPLDGAAATAAVDSSLVDDESSGVLDADSTMEAETGNAAVEVDAADEPEAGEPATELGDAVAFEAQVEDGEAVAEEPAEPSDFGAGEISTERVIEAILFASDEPLTPAKIVGILGTGSAREVRKTIQTLNAGYAKAGRAFRIEEIAGGYQMLTLPEYNTWLRRLRQSRQDSRLSPAAMETLAVIAYKQPVVRAEIEAIRGVSVGEVLNRLRELGLVKIVGRAEDVGRPMLYGTTKHFLELFGLGSLEDLPAIEELQMPQ